MGFWLYIVLIAAFTGGALIATGRWRAAFGVFAIKPQRMTVRALGLKVSPENEDRINALLRSFSGGFNAMITKPSLAACRGYCESLPALFRPFAEEGMAMGYTLRHLFRYDASAFEAEIVKPRPEFRYLYYVGLGFWSGMRNHDPQRLVQVTSGLDRLHRYLCFDGYGFKHAFFDYQKDPERLRRLDVLEGYARNTAYQGVGRGLWFLYVDSPELLIEHIGRLGDRAIDAAGGVGLASAFVNPDRLEVAQALAMKMPREWHDQFHLGMCFALKARFLNDVDELERNVARLEPGVQDAVYASVRECDRVELQVRSDDKEDGYCRWRNTVAAWMADNIEYPLAGVKASKLETLKRTPASA